MENSSPNPSFSICDIRIQKQMSRSFGKSFPQKIALPKLRPHCSATCPNTWRAEPRKKNTLSFFKRNFTPAKSEMQGVFFLSGLLAYSPGRGACVHSFSFRSKKVRANVRIRAQERTWTLHVRYRLSLLLQSSRQPFQALAWVTFSHSLPGYRQKSPNLKSWADFCYCAQERTWTSTGLLPYPPQGYAYTNFATWALILFLRWCNYAWKEK